MSVVEIATESIRLAKAAEAEENGIAVEFGTQDDYSNSQLVARVSAPRPEQLRLMNYLESLERVVVFKLRTLMYVGRDGYSDIIDFHHELAGDTGRAAVEGAICSMVGKSTLADYLERGLAIADENGVDLDAVWPAPEKPQSVTPMTASARTTGIAARARFDAGQDPISNGGEVFRSLADEWAGDVIAERGEFARFLRKLYERTAGLVILDFIDFANWDQIEGYAFEELTGYLELYWHDYRNADNVPSKPERDFFPSSLYGLLIRLREIRIIRWSAGAAFLLSGYTLSRSEVRERLSLTSEEQVMARSRFFSSRFWRRTNNQVHVFDVLDSPLYTAAILPKGQNLNTSFSRFMLVTSNLERVRQRIRRASAALDRLEEEDSELICEKVNTIRRHWEQALKIELIHREIEPKGDYSSLMLGDLMALLKTFHPTTSRPIGRLIAWANELSHDTGRVVDVGQAREVASHVTTYVESILSEILFSASLSRPS